MENKSLGQCRTAVASTPGLTRTVAVWGGERRDRREEGQERAVHGQHHAAIRRGDYSGIALT